MTNNTDKLPLNQKSKTIKKIKKNKNNKNKPQQIKVKKEPTVAQRNKTARMKKLNVQARETGLYGDGKGNGRELVYHLPLHHTGSTFGMENFNVGTNEQRLEQLIRQTASVLLYEVSYAIALEVQIAYIKSLKTILIASNKPEGNAKLFTTMRAGFQTIQHKLNKNLHLPAKDYEVLTRRHKKIKQWIELTQRETNETMTNTIGEHALSFLQTLVSTEPVEYFNSNNGGIMQLKNSAKGRVVVLRDNENTKNSQTMFKHAERHYMNIPLLLNLSQGDLVCYGPKCTCETCLVEGNKAMNYPKSIHMGGMFPNQLVKEDEDTFDPAQLNELREHYRKLGETGIQNMKSMNLEYQRSLSDYQTNRVVHNVENENNENQIDEEL